MEQDNSFVNPQALIEQFNSLQNQFNQPTDVVNRGKEIVGNLLLGMGAPFFGERLAKTIGKPLYDSIKKAATGDFSDVLNLAKEKVQNEILPLAKQQLQEHVGKYIPELKDIDLENTSLSDLRNAFQTGITNRIKSALPQEVQDRLPADLTDTDALIGTVRQLGTDQALKVAKNTLPPDVYSQLEARQDLINDPSKIADVIRANVNTAKSRVLDIAKETQGQVEQRLNGLRNELLNKANETIKPLQDKVTQLQSAKDTALQKYNEAKQTITEQYNNAQSKYDEFRQSNPNATQEELQPFQDDIASVLQKVRDTKSAFLANDKDLGGQLDGAKSMLQSNTELLQSKLDNLRNGLSNRVAQIRQQVQEVPQRLQQQLNTQPTPPQPRPTTEQPRPLNIQDEEEQDITPAQPRAQPVQEEEPGIIDKFTTWAKRKFQKQTEPVTRRSEDVASQDEGFRPRLMQADEPENAFSENALGFRAPWLADYYGSELQDPKTLLQDPVGQFFREPSRQLPVKKLPKRAKPQQQEEARPAEETRPIVEPTRTDINRAATQGIETERGAPGAQNVFPDELRAQLQQQQPQQQPSTQPAEAEEAAPQPTQAQPTQLSEPVQTQTPPSTQPLTEQQPPQPSPITTEAEEGLAQTTEKVAEKETGSVASKVAAGLDEAAAGTEEVPVLDILMNTAGLLASIFGGKALLGGAEKEQLPSVSGAVYEPNL